MSADEIIAAFAQRLEANAEHAEAASHTTANLGIMPVDDCRVLAKALRSQLEQPGNMRKSVSENGQHVAPVPEPFEDAPVAGRLANPLVIPQLAKMISDLEPGGPAISGEVQHLPVHPLTFTYRNYRGEVSTRRVLPIKIYFGPTQWHPIPQYLLRALDLDKEAVRDFAWADISPAAEATTEAEAVAPEAVAPDLVPTIRAQADLTTARRGVVVAFTVAILVYLAAPYLFDWLAGR